jgi:hypothetical protein
MFRRLAEAFETGSNPHMDYITQQNTYYNAAPNMILSGTSGLPGFDKAIQTADMARQGDIQDYAVKNPNDIFMTGMSPNLTQMATQCAAGSMNDLIAAKNPNASIGCGWVYTPPNSNSPYPVVAKGALGNEKGPLPGVDVPAYKKWYFDLQLAKKQMLLDKCKALKACSDVDQDVFQGTCGFCTDIGQGVPIDSVGKPLYPNEPRGTCSPNSIVRNREQCPPPPPGPQPVRDKTCDPVNGRLSAACLYNTVLSGGCTDDGALANALRGSPNPSDYMATIRNGDAMKLYQQHANPKLNLNMFSQGDKTTVSAALQEVRQLASNANQPPSSALGASARDLCLQRGAVKGYDICSHLPDGTQAPFDMECLQSLFRKSGGQPKGTAYPSIANMAKYNAMGTLGAVKQYWSQLITAMKSADSFTDYATQREAMSQFLGITPETGITRAPYTQGVEVFWFVPVPGNPQRVIGFLKRTIERDFVQLQAGQSRVPQIGGGAYGCFVQLTDVRAPSDSSIRYDVVVDDGFWIAVNQPADIDKTAMTQQSVDTPGLFENLGLQGPTTYSGKSCSAIQAATPNIIKMFFEDAGGGWNAFQLTPHICGGANVLQSQYYSLTCDARAPFLTFEVAAKSGIFEELRNPGLFGQFVGIGGLEYHSRTDERVGVPGKKAFVRMNSANSSINMPNIAFQSWKTVSFCVRLQTMPIKETLFHFYMGQFYMAIIATPINGSTATISIEHNFSGSTQMVATSYQLSLNTWYMFYVNNMKSGMNIYCNSIDGFIASGGNATVTSLNANRSLWSLNGTWNPVPGQTSEVCNLMVGAGNFKGQWPGVYGSSSCSFDLAWIHFFDKPFSKEDILRESKSDWVYTQFPESYNKYKTLTGQ